MDNINNTEYIKAIKRINTNLTYARKNAPEFAKNVEKMLAPYLKANGKVSYSTKVPEEVKQQLYNIDKNKLTSWGEEKKSLKDLFKDRDLPKKPDFNELEKIKQIIIEDIDNLINDYSYDDYSDAIFNYRDNNPDTDGRRLTYSELEEVINNVKRNNTPRHEFYI